MKEEEITFRALCRADLPLIQRWLSQPHVDAWWHEPLDLTGVEAKYGPRIDGTEPTHVFVIMYARRAIGWIQWYRWADYPEHAALLGAEPGTAGVDLAIGEVAMLGRGIGPRALSAFIVGVVFGDPGVSACVSDPEELNRRSIRAFEKAGFVAVRTVHLPGEAGLRRVVRLERG